MIRLLLANRATLAEIVTSGPFWAGVGVGVWVLGLVALGAGR